MDNQQMPHSIEGHPNGLFSNHFESLYQNGQDNHGFEDDWTFSSNQDQIPATATSLYQNQDWRNTPVSTPGLANYTQPLSKGTSYSQQPPYQGYDNLRQFQRSPYDPALVTHSSEPQYGYQTPESQQPQYLSRTIAPQALQHQTPRPAVPPANSGPQAYIRGGASHESFQYDAQVNSVDQAALCRAIPIGQVDGIFSTIDYNKLATSTTSKRMHNFVNVGQQDFEYPINRSAIPTPIRRRSRKDLRKLASADPKMLAKLGKKASKKTPPAGRDLVRTNMQDLQRDIINAKGRNSDLASSSESSSEEDSSDYDSDEDMAEPSPLPPVRPEAPLEAVKYDSMKALWRNRRRDVDSTEIRDALADYWVVVRTIRDRWKSDASAVTTAEEKKQNDELPLLRSRVKHQRDMIEVAFKTALEYGHPGILALFAENQSFLFICYQFLLDRFKEGDVDGSLAKVILESLALCSTLTEEKLEKVHLVKVLPRFSKKGTADTQSLVARIQSAATAGSKRAAAKPKPESTGEIKPATGLPKSPTGAGLKRAAPTADGPGQPAKKLSASAGPVKAPATGAVKVVPGATVKKIVPGAGAARPAISMSAGPPPAPKAKPAAARPSAFFSGLQAATKKPTATPAAKPAASSVVAAALKAVQANAAAPASAAAKPSFSFASTMANLTKAEDKKLSPKPEQQKYEAETPEERKKRLRKESRRSLRVSFKPASALVEVRYFTHDPEEEQGHDSSMVRDVSDVGGEGRMFKQHKEMADLEDDDDGPGEEDARPYKEPRPINFEDVEQDERDRNYAPYGGGVLTPESDEKVKRDQHEASTLMVFYTKPSDIPPSPKEPIETTQEEKTELKSFGAPHGVVSERAARYQKPSQAASAPVASVPDISSILAALNPQQPQQQPPAPSAPPPQDSMSEIQRILASFGQPQTQSAAPAPAPSVPPPQASGQAPNLANIFASMQPQTGGGNVPQQSAAPNAGAANLASLFAQITNGQAAGAGAATTFNAGGQPGLPFAVPDMSQFGQQTQDQGYPYENEERRRWREENEDGGDYDGANDRQNKKRKGEWSKNNYYTLPCKYWQQGKCQKGDKCTYRHD